MTQIRFNILSRFLTRFVSVTAMVAIAAAIAASQSDTEAKISSAAPVVIPDSIFAAGVGGKLVYSVSVSEGGKVTNVRLLAGPAWPCSGEPKDEVREAAKIVREALAATTFSPRIKNGRPTDAELQLTYLIKRSGEPGAAAPGEARPKRINGGIIQGKAKSLPKPSYPPEARANRASGEVGIEVQIDLDGRVRSAGAVSGHPDLQRAARDAACLARFSQTFLNREPVEVTGVMQYNFVP
jgi:TonB family protein